MPANAQRRAGRRLGGHDGADLGAAVGPGQEHHGAAIAALRRADDEVGQAIGVEVAAGEVRPESLAGRTGETHLVDAMEGGGAAGRDREAADE